ncbi:curli production assembly protein CsgE [Pseudomonas sp. A46]|nr:curli production assembly/transport protein CsgE [Pseudomonas sp. A46]OWJ97541.1 curli production assembly protein CsgE [Pseudomonas sp. A46]
MTRRLALTLLLIACLSGAARAEEEIMGFIVDHTVSHIGHEFYRAFSERLRDTSKLDFNLVVRERPDARWGSLVWVEYEQRLLYRQFLPPNTSELKPTAYAAADLVLEAIAQQKLQRLLQDTHDLERDEL